MCVRACVLIRLVLLLQLDLQAETFLHHQHRDRTWIHPPHCSDIWTEKFLPEGNQVSWKVYKGVVVTPPPEQPSFESTETCFYLRQLTNSFAPAYF